MKSATCATADFTDRRRAFRQARQARYRARVRARQRIAPVAFDEDVLDLLVRLNWLSEADAGDVRAVGDAISALVSHAARPQ